MYSKTYRHISTIPTTPGSLLSSSTDPALPPHTPLGEGQEHGDLNVNSCNNVCCGYINQDIILLWNVLYRSLIDN